MEVEGRAARTAESGRGTAPRRAALAALAAHESAGRPFQEALSETANTLPPPDKALAREIAEGVLRMQGSLDGELRAFSSQSLERLEPLVRAALRAGLYQLRHLDRVPPHAAVAATVGALDSRGQRGYVNAVLRKAAQAKPPASSDCAPTAPEWMRRRWASWMTGGQLEEIDAWLLSRPVITVRSTAPGSEAPGGGVLGPHPALEGSWLVKPDFLHSPAFAAGHWFVQDGASSLPCLLAAAAASPGTVLDLCAAPGGKSLALCAALPDARVVAVEWSQRRMAALLQNRRRCSLEHRVSVLCADAGRLPLRYEARFGLVFLDAPCSGWGTLRKNPDAFAKAAPATPGERSRVQAPLLEAAAARVAPGGVLAYNVCSIEPEEGEQLAAFFTKQAGEAFTLLRPALPDGMAPSSVWSGHGWTLIPSAPREHDGGFFAMWRRDT